MTYRIKMFNDDTSKGTEPQWWINFINNLPLNASVDDVNQRLAEYNMKFVLENGKTPYGNRYLDFPDEKSYTIFLLRWS